MAVVSTKAFVAKVAEKTGYTQKEVKEVLKAVNLTIVEEVKEENEVQFMGFGTYKKSIRAARKGRNPQTGQEVEIPESHSLNFKASSVVKAALIK